MTYIIILSAVILIYILIAILQMRRDSKQIKQTIEYFQDPDSLYNKMQEIKRQYAELEAEEAVFNPTAECKYQDEMKGGGK